MNKKRVLLVGAFSHDPTVYTYASSFHTALETLGYQVLPFNYRPRPSSFLPGTNRLSTYLSRLQINKKLVQEARSFKPEIVFIVKGEMITPHALLQLKTLGARIANFYPDNPFALWNGNSTPHVLHALPLFDCFLSWSERLTPALLASGARHSCPFPFAYDSGLFNPSLTFSAAELAPYASDVCFVGTWEPKREELLEQAIRQLPQYSFAIWGNHWDKQTRSALVRSRLRGPAIYGSTLVKAYKGASIILNFLRDQNADAHNMRSFEAPALHTFLLTERSSWSAQGLFVEGVSSACFSGPQELCAKIDYYLRNPDKRDSISQHAHAVAQHYSLEKQLQHYLWSCPFLR